jgi:hypothetical protein
MGINEIKPFVLKAFNHLQKIHFAGGKEIAEEEEEENDY